MIIIAKCLELFKNFSLCNFFLTFIPNVIIKYYLLNSEPEILKETHNKWLIDTLINNSLCVETTRTPHTFT